MVKMDKKRLFFIISALIIIVSMIYLGARAIKHEVLTRQSQSQQFAKSRMDNIALTTKTLLEQKASYFEAIASFIEPTPQNIDHLINNEIDIKQVFIIREDNIIYPLSRGNDNQTEQWFALVDAIRHDPSVLTAHYMDFEQAKPQAGWYLTYDNNGSILIYWLKQDDYIIGFQLSYVKLLLDLILEIDNQLLTDQFVIKDNGQVIYDNRPDKNTVKQYDHSLSLLLNYPLKNWQIDYYYQDQNNAVLYLFGFGVLAAIVAFIIALFIYSYREYNRTLRLVRQQVNFVGQVSHEFKTPLTNIMLYSEMLQERLEDSPAPVPEYLEIINQESQRLTRLIQNVLNFTKSSKMMVSKIHLNTLLAKNCAIFRPIMANKSIQLNFTSCSKDDVVTSDADSIIQVVNNLLNNAEKYAAHGKQVDLSVSKQNEQFIISVRDYGNGIPAQSLSLIFKPFYRLNSELTEGVAGTGIGLTIAKQLAIKLHGDITVKNCQPGVEFCLIIPVSIDNKESTV